MRVQAIVVCVALTMGATGMQAQMGAASAAPAAGTKVQPAKAIDAQLNIIQSELMGAAKAMPADKYDFAPSQAIFSPAQKTQFATVRTFGQEVAHVAQANYYFFSNASGLPMDSSVAGIGKLTKKEDIVAALAGSFAFGRKAIATITAENAFEVVKFEEIPGVIETRATLAQFAISHANDHYGQMVEYLRMNGIVPPASAK